MAILSICVPTYSRAASLRSLFANLVEVASDFGGDIEICVSDNASIDDTPMVVAEYTGRLPLRYERQAENIGGTRNILAVSRMARGNFVVLVGDDDLIDRETLTDLVAALKLRGANTWLLVDASHGEERQAYFRDVRGRAYSAADFRGPLLREGVHPLSFMGVHIFPREAVGLWDGLTMHELRPWPHVALLLRFMARSGSSVEVWNRTLVEQAGGSESLFWEAGDLARMRLDKVKIIATVPRRAPGHGLFLIALMLREAFRRDIIATLFAWRIYEPAAFNSQAVRDVAGRARNLGFCAPVLWPHVLFVAALRCVPGRLLDTVLRKLRLAHKAEIYHDTKRRIGQHDALQRGL